MKLLFSKPYGRGILCIWFWVLLPSAGYASLQYTQLVHPGTAIRISSTSPERPVAAVGFFKKLQRIKIAKRMINTRRGRTEGERASPLARVALGLYFGSLAVLLIPTYLSVAVSFLAFFTSIVLACVVLLKKPNRKSKKIARTILIVSGLLAILLLVFVGPFFNSL